MPKFREPLNTWLYNLAEHGDWYGWWPRWFWFRFIAFMDRSNGYWLDYDD